LNGEQKPIQMGILGGMGPLATSFFFDRIVRHTEAACDQDHIDICILNRASMPDRTKEIEEGTGEHFVKLAVDDCRKMEANARMQEWWTHTKPCFVNHDKQEYYLDWKEIFYLA